MPPDLAWEEAEDAPKMVEALTTRVTVGVVTLVAGAAFTPVLSRTIVGFCNLRFKTFKTTTKKRGIHQNGGLASNTRDITCTVPDGAANFLAVTDFTIVVPF